MIAETGAAFSSIKAAFDIIRGISALKTEAEVNLAVIEVQRILIDAQAAALEDKQMIALLSDEIVELKRRANVNSVWESEKQRYVLTQSLQGPVTYDLRPELANGEIQHRLCATCFGAERKTILQTIAKHSGGELVKCPVCNVELLLADFNSDYASVGRRRSYDPLDF
jgi:hypothetical protein